MKPLLKWVGGKSKLLDTLRPLLPVDYGRKKYVDPFLGGGAMLFDIAPRRAALSDVNADLIRTYQSVRDRPVDVLTELRYLAVNDSEDFFYCTRAAFNNEESPYPVVRAAQMIYLNKTCFNGLWRVNTQGFFNTSYGFYKAPSFPSEAEIQEVSEFLQPHILLARNYSRALLREFNGPGTFVYLDPPYDENFTSYHAQGFRRDDHARLKGYVDLLTKRGASVMVSNSDTPFIRDLYRDYTIENIQAPRSVSADGNLRGKVQEVVIMNYKERQV